MLNNMIDSLQRNINYLRVSVTRRCNLNCYYCSSGSFSKDGAFLQDDREITFAEIVEIVKAAVQLGIKKVRLTGGEPLLRQNIEDLVLQLSAIKGIDDLAMTTNGVFLAQYAKSLAQAGLMRVNVSLDTTDPDRFCKITGGGDVRKVFAGIDAAREAGLTPLKLNCVIKDNTEEADAKLVQEYAQQKRLEVRFIKLIDFTTGSFSKVYGGHGGDCSSCNRLRLLSNGKILPCLFSKQTFDTKKLGIVEALTQAVINKPEKGIPCKGKQMRDIGG
jgi:GTP 3',8-cyclase